MGGGGTYDQISKMLDAHYSGKISIADYWAVGDVREETIKYVDGDLNPNSTLTDECKLCILGFDHDKMNSSINGINKSAVTIQTLDCIQTACMNNIGTGDEIAIWSKTSLRSKLINYAINAFPTELTNLMKTPDKLSNKFADSAYKSYLLQETTSDKIFLLSDAEVFGSNLANSYTSSELSLDGEQYEYMKTVGNRGKKYTGRSVTWWTRTSNAGSLGYCYFSIVDPSGSHESGQMNEKNGVAPAFCL